MKPRVLVDPCFRPRRLVYSDDVWDRMNDLCEVVWGEDENFPDERFDEIRDVEAILGGWWRYGALADWPKLRAFIETGGGLPSPASFDYPHAFAKNVRVLSCSPAFATAVAEMGLGLALACSRQIARTSADFRAGTEPWSHSEFRGEFTLYGKTIGFIGYGAIGRHLRALLAPWNVRILGFDPWMTHAYLASQGIEPTTLPGLLERADASFVLATPSATNQGLVSREMLAHIPDGKVFVLLSRAHLVDFDALTDLALSGRVQLGIDVFPEEPLTADHPIRRAPHAVLSSHRAGAQIESIRRIGEIVVRDLEAILQGFPPRECQSAEPEYLGLRGNV